MVHNGRKLTEDTLLEQINILSNAKLLLLPMTFKSSKLKRYEYVYSYWSISKEDGVCFSVNKSIRLNGVSIFKLCEQKPLSSVDISIYEGDSSNGILLYTQKSEMSYTPDCNEKDSIIEVMFKNSLKLNGNTDYSIMIRLPNRESTYFYYGSSGQSTVTLDNNVTINFKDCKNCSTYSTGGNFPFIYYSS